VRGDEAPKAQPQAVLPARRRHHAHLQAVPEHHEDGSQTRRDAGGKGHEAHGDVVRHDECGGLGLGAEDGFRPHAVVLDGIYHLRAKQGVHELRPRQRQQHAKHAARNEQRECHRRIRQQPAKEPRIAVQQKLPHRGRTKASARVDVVVRATDQPVEIRLERARSLVRAYGGEVRGGLPVEQPEVPQVVDGERLQAARLDLPNEDFQAAPAGSAEFDPAIGNHDLGFYLQDEQHKPLRRPA
jgi:hypothetical protein